MATSRPGMSQWALLRFFASGSVTKAQFLIQRRAICRSAVSFVVVTDRRGETRDTATVVTGH